MYKKIAIIGCGPHFRAIYSKVIASLIAKHNLQIKFLVDLEQERDTIQTFLNEVNLKQIPQIYLTPEVAACNHLTESILNTNISNDIDAILICTEAKYHKQYIMWGLKHDLHIFVDKPLTVYYKGNTDIYKDFLDIKNLSMKKLKKVFLSCERRLHFGYIYLKQTISNLINSYKIPITAIDIHYAGGNWVMPCEYGTKENHPFKYGYGILFHSGYHYVDLLVSFVKLNEVLFKSLSKNFKLNVFRKNPEDIARIYSDNIFNVLNTDTNNFSNITDYSTIDYGETDITCGGQFFKNNNPITNFTLNINGTSVSRRTSTSPAINPYKDSGRIRQERVIIHLGHLISIHVSSLPKNKLSDKYMIDDFNIEILSNPNVKELKPYTKIDRKQLTKYFQNLPINLSMNRYSRAKQLENFLLEHEDEESKLSSHEESIKLMHEISRKLYEQ